VPPCRTDFRGEPEDGFADRVLKIVLDRPQSIYGNNFAPSARTRRLHKMLDGSSVSPPDVPTDALANPQIIGHRRT
jgi:hypothetical protein